MANPPAKKNCQRKFLMDVCQIFTSAAEKSAACMPNGEWLQGLPSQK
jgi:hypothetical protein